MTIATATAATALETAARATAAAATATAATTSTAMAKHRGHSYSSNFCYCHPKKMTVDQAANLRLDVPRKVCSLQRREISSLITTITSWLVQLGLVIFN